MDELKSALNHVLNSLKNLRNIRSAVQKRLNDRKKRRDARIEARNELNHQLNQFRNKLKSPHTPERDEKIADEVERLEARVQELHGVIGNFKPRIRRFRRRLNETEASIRWFVARKTKLRKKIKAKQEASGPPGFELWMLNGRGSNITNAVKAEIAIGVINFGLFVTSTTTGPHTSTSLHFPYNNADGKGHAVDIAGARQTEFQNARMSNPGPGHFQEFFGPNSTNCAKNGTRISIFGSLATAHKTHDHDGPFGS